MIRTLSMDVNDARLYMAGTSLTRFIGFESLEEYCANTVIAVGDIITDEMLYFSNSIDRDVKHLEIYHTKRFSDYFEHSVAAYVAPEYLPQADLFFSLAHLRHCYEQGILNDSISYPCYVLDDTVYIRASFEIEFDEELGHPVATVVLIDVTRFHQAQQQLTIDATCDSLTGAINRATAHEIVATYIKEHLDGPAALAVVNIDSFRTINEKFGHEWGDRALMNFVDEMRTTFGRNVTVSRTSGDEFLLFFPDTAAMDAELVISVFAGREHEAFSYAGKVARFSVSVGYAMYPEDCFTYDDLVTAAHATMQVAKSDVTTHWQRYDPEIASGRREQTGLTLRELGNSMPTGILVYRAYGDEEIVYANRYLINLFGCDGLDDFLTLTEGSFAGFVHPDDYARVNREIWSQIKGVEQDNDDFVRYRIIDKAGVEHQIVDFGRLVESEAFGKVFYVTVYEQVSREMWEAFSGKNATTPEP